ncbi:MAG: UvrD-helicase domain-containing protein, partial [Sphingomonas bacterium]
IRAACADDAIDRRALDAIARLNREWGTKNGIARAEAISTWLAGDVETRAASLADLHLVWAKADGDPRSFGKGQAPQEPDYADMAMRLHGHCAELLSLRIRAAFADLLADALAVGRDYARAYAAAKRRVGAVDFDDLIAATVDLFDQPGIGEWVRFKLDQITEHVLIDEAQDTNANQWRIVRALVDEYFVGRGVHAPSTRTLFTVGDHKQAIFGFQGTDPINFAAAETYFAHRAEEVRGDGTMADEERGLPFEKLSLVASFRSTRPVLEFVDAAIDRIGHEALGMADAVPPHASEVPGPGVVELWPPVCAGAAEGDDGEEEWIDDAVRENATRIARQVRLWLDQGLMLESKGRPLRPEDVMILVKRRGELAQLLVARLYAEGVPVAGVDRLRLNAPLAVQDLLAAIRFVLQPDDDLSLASLLVSPLIGWTQEELLARAVPRSGSLWRHLSARHRALLGPLDAMLARADFTTPYQFLEEILSGDLGGRRKLLERLGEEARDPIEELLSAALDFETTTTPSLQRFLDWFDRGEVEIVRDAAQPRDAVRVMTAHGAKGLQAPLVILADATADPDAAMRSALMWTPPEGVAPLPVFRPRKEERAGTIDDEVAAADLRERQEHWRLFYVAATRAEERLVIAGSLSRKWEGVPPPESWYGLSADTFAALGVTGTFTGIAPATAARPRAAARQVVVEAAPLPEWARRTAPQDPRPPRPLAPSSLGEDVVADPPPTPAMRAAAERGRLIHALFERLPAVRPEDRARAADRWLAEVGQVADARARAEIAGDALRVIDDPAYTDMFGSDALAEAPISAVLPDGIVVAGTVDRLLVTETTVRVVDFKTGRQAPRDAGEVPAYHLGQMAAYAAALAVIFPGRAIEAALLYTAGPILLPLAPDLLAAHKPGYRVQEQS